MTISDWVKTQFGCRNKNSLLLLTGVGQPHQIALSQFSAAGAIAARIRGADLVTAVQSAVNKRLGGRRDPMGGSPTGVQSEPAEDTPRTVFKSAVVLRQADSWLIE